MYTPWLACGPLPHHRPSSTIMVAKPSLIATSSSIVNRHGGKTIFKTALGGLFKRYCILHPVLELGLL